MTEHVSTYTAPMFNACPYCKAQPLQPCTSTYGPSTGRTGTRIMRVTHVERNRA